MTHAVPKLEQKVKAGCCWTLFPSRFCTGGKLASALSACGLWIVELPHTLLSAPSDLLLLHQENAVFVTPRIFWVTISRYSPYICPAISTWETVLKPLQWHIIVSLQKFLYAGFPSSLLPDLPLSMIQKNSETAEPLSFSIYYLLWDPLKHAKRGFITNLPYKFFRALKMIFQDSFLT